MTPLELLRTEFTALQALVKASRFVYEADPADKAGWEPPQPPGRTRWRWNKEKHGGPPKRVKQERGQRTPSGSAELPRR